MKSALFLGAFVNVFGTLPVHAAPRYPVAPIPGFECMALKVSDSEAMNPWLIVPLKAEPTNASSDVGRVSAILFVKTPEVVQNGFVEAMIFNGQRGWVSASAIKPWKSMNGSSQQCIPSRMSDGSIGFDLK